MEQRTFQTALVTGANRGLGLAFVEEAVERGAYRIFAAARDIETCRPLVDRFGPTVQPVTLDLSDSDSIDSAVDAIADVDLLVSNAGVTMIGPYFDHAEPDLRRMFEVNFWGPQRLVRGLVPQLQANRGGILHILSIAALLPATAAEAYSASKAAAMMAGHGIRHALGECGVGVTLCYPGFVESDMGRNFPVPRAPARLIASRALDDWQRGKTSSFPDTFSKMTRDALREQMDRILAEPGHLLGEMVGEFIDHPEAGS